MSQRVELEEVNKRIRDMYEKYNEALSNNNYDAALEVGTRMVEELLRIYEEIVMPVLTDPRVREVAREILSFHEQMLAFVRGTREALRNMPVIYSFGAKEKAVEALTSSINGLFNFVLGSLVVLAELRVSAGLGRGRAEVPGVI